MSSCHTFRASVHPLHRSRGLALLLLLLSGAATAACSFMHSDKDELGGSESAYTNVSGESEAITLPASYAIRSTLGTGLNTVFMRAVDTPCVTYVRQGERQGPALGEAKFQATTVTMSSSREVANALGVQAGMSASYGGLLGAGSVDVDFGFSNQSNTKSEAVYVLVKAWGEADDRSQAGATPELTPEALSTWELGPYELASRCGNNFVSRRQVGAGIYLLYRFTANDGVSKKHLHTLVSGKLKARVVDASGRAEVNVDVSDILKQSSMEFTMAVYGMIPGTAPNLDRLKAQDSGEIERVIGSVFTALRDASARGPESQEFANLATIALQSSPYHTRLPAARYQALRTKFEEANVRGAELDLLVPDMARVQKGVDTIWARMMDVSDSIGDARYIQARPAQFNRKENAVPSYGAGGPDVFGMQGWIEKLEADWRALREQALACKDGGTRTDRYRACDVVEDNNNCQPGSQTTAATTAACKSNVDVSAFRAARPRRLEYVLASVGEGYDGASERCRAIGWRLPKSGETTVVSAVDEHLFASSMYWVADDGSCPGGHTAARPGQVLCLNGFVANFGVSAALCVPSTGVFSE